MFGYRSGGQQGFEGTVVTEPRLISGADAAAYCSVTPATFSKWVALGVMPKPVLGTRRWDRKAIDRALDRASGIEPPSATPDEDPFETWKRQQEAAEDEWERKYEARKNGTD